MTTTAVIDTIPAAEDRLYSVTLSHMDVGLPLSGTASGNYVAKRTLSNPTEFLSDHEFVMVVGTINTVNNGGVRCQGVIRLDSNNTDVALHGWWIRCSLTASNLVGFLLQRGSGITYAAYIDGTAAANRMHQQWRLAIAKRIKADASGDHEVQVWTIRNDNGAIVKSGWTTIDSDHVDLDDIHNVAAGGEYRISSLNTKTNGAYGTPNPVVQSTPIICRFEGTGDHTFAGQFGTDENAIDAAIRNILMMPVRALQPYRDAGAFDRVYNWRLCTAGTPVANRSGIAIIDDGTHQILDQSGQNFHLTFDATATTAGSSILPEFQAATHYPANSFSARSTGSPRRIQIPGGYQLAALTQGSNQDKLGLFIYTLDSSGHPIDWPLPCLALARELNAAVETANGYVDVQYSLLASFSTDNHKGICFSVYDDGAGDRKYVLAGPINHSQDNVTVAGVTNPVFAVIPFAVIHDAALCPRPTFLDEMPGDMEIDGTAYDGNEVIYEYGCASYVRALSIGATGIVWGMRSQGQTDGFFSVVMYDGTDFATKVLTDRANSVNNAGITNAPVFLGSGRVLFTARIRNDGSTNDRAIMGIIGNCLDLTTFADDASWTTWDGLPFTIGALRPSDDAFNMWPENNDPVAAEDRDNCRCLDLTVAGDYVVAGVAFAADQADNRPYETDPDVFESLVIRRYENLGDALVDTDGGGGWLDVTDEARAVMGYDATELLVNTLDCALTGISDHAVAMILCDKATAVTGSGAGEPFTDRSEIGATAGIVTIGDIGGDRNIETTAVELTPPTGSVAVALSTGYQGVGAYPTTYPYYGGWHDDTSAWERAGMVFGGEQDITAIIPDDPLSPSGEEDISGELMVARPPRLSTRELQSAARYPSA